MDVLSGRVMLHPADPRASQAFYRDVLGLAVYREFGSIDHPGVVFFLGGGFLEIFKAGPADPQPAIDLWLQVRDVHAEYRRLVALGAPIELAPTLQPWGLLETRLRDPDGVGIVLVEVPADHPLRRDSRPMSQIMPPQGPAAD